jgi:hypothetical protein
VSQNALFKAITEVSGMGSSMKPSPYSFLSWAKNFTNINMSVGTVSAEHIGPIQGSLPR